MSSPLRHPMDGSHEPHGVRGVASNLRDIGTDLGGMAAGLVEAPVAEVERIIADPEPLIEKRHWLLRWSGVIVNLAILAAVINELRAIDMVALRTVIPASISFWLLYGAYYLATPTADWTIFRRLWPMPGGGFLALMRKQVSNELLFNYIGELYFYSWARQHVKLSGSPFGAIKDVAILSALVGNVITLAMVLLAWPVLAHVDIRWNADLFGWSIGFILAISILVIVFGNRVFSLRSGQLRWASGVHALRMVATVFLSACAWAIALPMVGIALWLVLATMRQVVARLPFLPNKDLVFAGLAVFLIGGNDGHLAALMAFWAGLIILTHIIVGVVLAGQDVLHAIIRRARGFTNVVSAGR